VSAGGGPAAVRRLADPGEVRRAFRWSHVPAYRWSLDATGAGRLRLLALTRLAAAAVLAPVAAFAAPFLVGQIHPAAGVWAAALLGLVLVAPYLVWLLLRLRRADSVRLRRAAWTRSVLLAGALGSLVYLVSADASPLRAGFTPGPEELGAGDWAGYVVEQMASLVLFDLPRVLHLRLAPIRPESGPALAAMLAFRVLFALGLAEAAAELWRSFRSGSQVFHASVPGAFLRCALISVGRLRREGELKLEGMCSPVPLLLFLKLFHADAQRAGWTGFRDSPKSGR
jgi:hypothetical protein